jgi:hypothetical protein
MAVYTLPQAGPQSLAGCSTTAVDFVAELQALVLALHQAWRRGARGPLSARTLLAIILGVHPDISLSRRHGQLVCTVMPCHLRRAALPLDSWRIRFELGVPNA